MIKHEPGTGAMSVWNADGTFKGLVPNEPVIVALNKFGQEGWELIQAAGSTPDSGGVTNYILKRPALPPVEKANSYDRTG